jgi:hypothetical protein
MINHCRKLVEESKELDEQLSQCDSLAEHAEALLQYEERGIATIRPLPSELIRVYRDGKDDLILRSAEREVESAIAAAKVMAGPDAKASQLSKALAKIRDYKTKLGKAGHLDAVERKMADLVHQTQLTVYLDEARDADIRGLRKRALELYKYALHFLEGEGISESLRQDNLPAVEAKIAALIGPEEGEEEEEKAEEQEESETEQQ